MTVHAQHPNFHFFDCGMDFKASPLCKSEANLVDFAFGPEDDNQKVYDSIVGPLIDLSLQGGFAVLFAYGQTGAGKTYTVNGILERVAHDLIKRQKGNQLKEDGTSNIKMTASFFQLIGNDSTDLLNDLNPFKIGEDKFGRVEMLGLK